jgi:thymidylate synthase (FAD)
MPRAHSPGADQYLDQQIPVLDHGFVKLIDYMGDDASIARAARNSYGKGTKTVSDDRALIRRLVRDQHTSPLEMAEIVLHMRMPIFVARQHIRHRTASLNEYSGRYSVMPDLAFVPAQDDISVQHATNKQGRGQPVEPAIAIRAASAIARLNERAFADYHELLDMGVAREMARVVLPLSAYTEMTWKIDLHNLMHFLRLRLALDAQHEIWLFAEAIATIVQEWVPLVWEAFVDYHLSGSRLSGADHRLLQRWLDGDRVDPRLDPAHFGMSKTEAAAFMDKWGAAS